MTSQISTSLPTHSSTLDQIISFVAEHHNTMIPYPTFAEHLRPFRLSPQTCPPQLLHLESLHYEIMKHNVVVHSIYHLFTRLVTSTTHLMADIHYHDQSRQYKQLLQDTVYTYSIPERNVSIVYNPPSLPKPSESSLHTSPYLIHTMRPASVYTNSNLLLFNSLYNVLEDRIRGAFALQTLSQIESSFRCFIQQQLSRPPLDNNHNGQQCSGLLNNKRKRTPFTTHSTSLSTTSPHKSQSTFIPLHHQSPHNRNAPSAPNHDFNPPSLNSPPVDNPSPFFLNFSNLPTTAHLDTNEQLVDKNSIDPNFTKLSSPNRHSSSNHQNLKSSPPQSQNDQSHRPAQQHLLSPQKPSAPRLSITPQPSIHPFHLSTTSTNPVTLRNQVNQGANADSLHFDPNFTHHLCQPTINPPNDNGNSNGNDNHRVHRSETMRLDNARISNTKRGHVVDPFQHIISDDDSEAGATFDNNSSLDGMAVSAFQQRKAHNNNQVRYYFSQQSQQHHGIDTDHTLTQNDLKNSYFSSQDFDTSLDLVQLPRSTTTTRAEHGSSSFITRNAEKTNIGKGATGSKQFQPKSQRNHIQQDHHQPFNDHPHTSHHHEQLPSLLPQNDIFPSQMSQNDRLTQDVQDNTQYLRNHRHSYATDDSIAMNPLNLMNDSDDDIDNYREKTHLNKAKRPSSPVTFAALLKGDLSRSYHNAETLQSQDGYDKTRISHNSYDFSAITEGHHLCNLAKNDPNPQDYDQITQHPTQIAAIPLNPPNSNSHISSTHLAMVTDLYTHNTVEDSNNLVDGKSSSDSAPIRTQSPLLPHHDTAQDNVALRNDQININTATTRATAFPPNSFDSPLSAPKIPLTTPIMLQLRDQFLIARQQELDQAEDLDGLAVDDNFGEFETAAMQIGAGEGALMGSLHADKASNSIGSKHETILTTYASAIKMLVNPSFLFDFDEPRVQEEMDKFFNKDNNIQNDLIDDTVSLCSRLSGVDQNQFQGNVDGVPCAVYDVYDFTHSSLLKKTEKQRNFADSIIHPTNSSTSHDHTFVKLPPTDPLSIYSLDQPPLRLSSTSYVNLTSPNERSVRPHQNMEDSPNGKRPLWSIYSLRYNSSFPNQFPSNQSNITNFDNSTPNSYSSFLQSFLSPPPGANHLSYFSSFTEQRHSTSQPSSFLHQSNSPRTATPNSPSHRTAVPQEVHSIQPQFTQQPHEEGTQTQIANLTHVVDAIEIKSQYEHRSPPPRCRNNSSSSNWSNYIPPTTQSPSALLSTLSNLPVATPATTSFDKTSQTVQQLLTQLDPDSILSSRPDILSHLFQPQFLSSLSNTELCKYTREVVEMATGRNEHKYSELASIISFLQNLLKINETHIIKLSNEYYTNFPLQISTSILPAHFFPLLEWKKSQTAPTPSSTPFAAQESTQPTGQFNDETIILSPTSHSIHDALNLFYAENRFVDFTDLPVIQAALYTHLTSARPATTALAPQGQGHDLPPSSDIINGKTYFASEVIVYGKKRPELSTRANIEFVSHLSSLESIHNALQMYVASVEDDKLCDVGFDSQVEKTTFASNLAASNNVYRLLPVSTRNESIDDDAACTYRLKFDPTIAQLPTSQPCRSFQPQSLHTPTPSIRNLTIFDESVLHTPQTRKTRPRTNYTSGIKSPTGSSTTAALGSPQTDLKRSTTEDSTNIDNPLFSAAISHMDDDDGVNQHDNVMRDSSQWLPVTPKPDLNSISHDDQGTAVSINDSLASPIKLPLLSTTPTTLSEYYQHNTSKSCLTSRCDSQLAHQFWFQPFSQDEFIFPSCELKYDLTSHPSAAFSLLSSDSATSLSSNSHVNGTITAFNTPSQQCLTTPPTYQNSFSTTAQINPTLSPLKLDTFHASHSLTRSKSTLRLTLSQPPLCSASSIHQFSSTFNGIPFLLPQLIDLHPDQRQILLNKLHKLPNGSLCLKSPHIPDSNPLTYLTALFSTLRTFQTPFAQLQPKIVPFTQALPRRQRLVLSRFQHHSSSESNRQQEHPILNPIQQQPTSTATTPASLSPPNTHQLLSKSFLPYITPSQSAQQHTQYENVDVITRVRHREELFQLQMDAFLESTLLPAPSSVLLHQSRSRRAFRWEQCLHMLAQEAVAHSLQLDQIDEHGPNTAKSVGHNLIIDGDKRKEYFIGMSPLQPHCQLPSTLSPIQQLENHLHFSRFFSPLLRQPPAHSPSPTPPLLLAECPTFSQTTPISPKRFSSLDIIYETHNISPIAIELYFHRFSRLFFHPNTPHSLHESIATLHLAMLTLLRFLSQLNLNFDTFNGIVVERLVIASIYTACVQRGEGVSLPLHIICNHAFHKENRVLIRKKQLRIKNFSTIGPLLTQTILQRSLPQLVCSHIPALHVASNFITTSGKLPKLFSTTTQNAKEKQSLYDSIKKHPKTTKFELHRPIPTLVYPSTIIKSPDVATLIELFHQHLGFNTNLLTPFDFYQVFLPHCQFDLVAQNLCDYLLELSLTQPFYSSYPPPQLAAAVILFTRYVVLSQQMRRNEYALLYFLQSKHYSLFSSQIIDPSDPLSTITAGLPTTSSFNQVVKDQAEMVQSPKANSRINARPPSQLSSGNATQQSSTQLDQDCSNQYIATHHVLTHAQTHPQFKALLPFSTPSFDQVTFALGLAWNAQLANITGFSLSDLLPLLKSLTHLTIIASGYSLNAASNPYSSHLPTVYIPSQTKIPQLRLQGIYNTQLSSTMLHQGHIQHSNITSPVVRNLYSSLIQIPKQMLNIAHVTSNTHPSTTTRSPSPHDQNQRHLLPHSTSPPGNNNNNSRHIFNSADVLASPNHSIKFPKIPMPASPFCPRLPPQQPNPNQTFDKTRTSSSRCPLPNNPSAEQSTQSTQYGTQPSSQLLPSEHCFNLIQIYPLHAHSELTPQSNRKYLTQHVTWVRAESIKTFLLTNHPDLFAQSTTGSIHSTIPYIQVGQYLAQIGPNAHHLGYTHPLYQKYTHPRYSAISERFIPPFELSPEYLRHLASLLNSPNISASSTHQPTLTPSAQIGTTYSPTSTILSRELVQHPIPISLPTFKKGTLRSYLVDDSYPTASPLPPQFINLQYNAAPRIQPSDPPSEHREEEIVKYFNQTCDSFFPTDLNPTAMMSASSPRIDTSTSFLITQIAKQFRVWDERNDGKWNYSQVYSQLHRLGISFFPTPPPTTTNTSQMRIDQGPAHANSTASFDNISPPLGHHDGFIHALDSQHDSPFLSHQSIMTTLNSHQPDQTSSNGVPNTVLSVSNRSEPGDRIKDTFFTENDEF